MVDINTNIDVALIDIDTDTGEPTGVTSNPEPTPDEITHITLHDAEGRAYVRFDIGTESVTYPVDRYESGATMRKAALSWGRQYGARRVRD